MEQSILESIRLAVKHYLVDHPEVTYEKLAESLDMTSNSLRNKLNGKTPWTFSEVLNLSSIIGKPIDELAGLKASA